MDRRPGEPAGALALCRAEDHRLLALVDAEMAEASRRAGPHLACRPGCVECCIGPFAITQLDALRLRAALADLARREPSRAEAIRRRAREAVAAMRASFPGDPETGILADDEGAEETFSATFAHVSCPVLDPDTGRCDLYDARPISCRTFGPPVQIGGEALPPCRLCFTAADRDEIERARVAVDPADQEGALLRRLEEDGLAAETIVAFAVAGSS